MNTSNDKKPKIRPINIELIAPINIKYNRFNPFFFLDFDSLLPLIAFTYLIFSSRILSNLELNFNLNKKMD